MKKYLIPVIFLVGLIVGVVAGLFIGKFIESKEAIKTGEISDFYRNADVYINLLSDDDFDYFSKYMEDYTSTDEYNSLLMKFIINEISSKDERIKNMMSALEESISKETKKDLTKEEKDKLFEKSNTCASLINGIKEQLSKKSQKETLDFIFYSPTNNGCLYSTTQEYNYKGFTYDDSYSTSSKVVYNASNNTQLESYITYYSYNYPYLSANEVMDQENKNRKKYNEYILKNSNYDTTLIK
jgi:hypothetical protein